MSDNSIGQIDVPIPQISHIAFVVENLEESMRQFGSLLGLEPWLLYRYEPPRLTSTTYHGETHEYSMKVAITDVKGPISMITNIISNSTLERIISLITSLRDQLLLHSCGTSVLSNPERLLSSLPNPGLPGINVELIEPLQGTSTYTEYLNKNGEGIHHIGCFAYDDPHAIVRMYEKEGISVIQSGRFEDVEFWYLDMRKELNGVILEIAANLWAIPKPDAIFPK
jgi:methylmalonyl-CoA/ethylmalonyl-CoA epimerase